MKRRARGIAYEWVPLLFVAAAAAVVAMWKYGGA